MANSSLATYRNISKHQSGTRTAKISKITIHHMSGKMTARQCADYFASTDREVSSNYCIGYDGSIAVSVDESDRSWCSSSRSNDQAAVTIEVSNIANSGDPDWKVSDAAMASLIKLCADVCKRNGIKKLYYDGTTSATLTRHCMFASTDCPGPYLKSKTTYICDEVNKLIGTSAGTTSGTTTTKTTLYRVRKTWADTSSQKGAYKNLTNAKACADKYPGYSVFDESGKAVYTSAKMTHRVQIDFTNKADATKCSELLKKSGYTPKITELK